MSVESCYLSHVSPANNLKCSIFFNFNLLKVFNCDLQIVLEMIFGLVRGGKKNFKVVVSVLYRLQQN